MTTLGEFIKERREAKGWSKRRLATEADISHTEVHADALGVPQEEMLRIAGYIDDDENVPLIARVFPDLKTEKQQETVQKIVDGLARNSDLEDKDYDNLLDQMEMFLAHAKRQKDSK